MHQCVRRKERDTQSNDVHSIVLASDTMNCVGRRVNGFPPVEAHELVAWQHAARYLCASEADAPGILGKLVEAAVTAKTIHAHHLIAQALAVPGVFQNTHPEVHQRIVSLAQTLAPYLRDKSVPLSTRIATIASIADGYSWEGFARPLCRILSRACAILQSATLGDQCSPSTRERNETLIAWGILSTSTLGKTISTEDISLGMYSWARIFGQYAIVLATETKFFEPLQMATLKNPRIGCLIAARIKDTDDDAIRFQSALANYAECSVESLQSHNGNGAVHVLCKRTARERRPPTGPKFETYDPHKSSNPGVPRAQVVQAVTIPTRKRGRPRIPRKLNLDDQTVKDTKRAKINTTIPSNAAVDMHAMIQPTGLSDQSCLNSDCIHLEGNESIHFDAQYMKHFEDVLTGFDAPPSAEERLLCLETPTPQAPVPPTPPTQAAIELESPVRVLPSPAMTSISSKELSGAGTPFRIHRFEPRFITLPSTQVDLFKPRAKPGLCINSLQRTRNTTPTWYAKGASNAVRVQWMPLGSTTAHVSLKSPFSVSTCADKQMCGTSPGAAHGRFLYVGA